MCDEHRKLECTDCFADEEGTDENFIIDRENEVEGELQQEQAKSAKPKTPKSYGFPAPIKRKNFLRNYNKSGQVIKSVKSKAIFKTKETSKLTRMVIPKETRVNRSSARIAQLGRSDQKKLAKAKQAGHKGNTPEKPPGSK